MIKVSIVIPVYNVACYLKDCLESVLAQSLQEIEIICVDDASQDGSKDILKQYALRDTRVVNIFHERNLGTSQVRKDGVLASRGDHVMFLDGDDLLEPDACEIAYEAIEKFGTDIVQFGVKIINCAGVSESRIDSNQRFVSPCLERVESENLIWACWKENKFHFNLWNKIYNGKMCRLAFEEIEDGYYPKAQDLYAFFVMAYYAKSSAGIEDVLYNYNFGVGVIGGNVISLEKFDILLTEITVYDALVRFVRKENVYEKYNHILSIIRHNFLNECVGKWWNYLRPESISEGFQHLVEVWGFEDTLCILAEREWYSRDIVAEKMLEVDFFNHDKRKGNSQTTIAAYYRSINNGGAQRVVASLCNIWAEMKNTEEERLYKVILITDGEPDEADYPLSDIVKREYIPDYESSIEGDFRNRFQAWTRILKDNCIDIVVSSMWVAPCTLWDMLCVKGYETKPAFMIHSHNFCCIPYQFIGTTGLELVYSYQLCDGAVTLSGCDHRFVSSFASNARCILNPLTFSPQEMQASVHEENTLVWVGRISAEKQPLDAIYMMEYIVKEIPNAKLYIVGSGDDALCEKMEALVESLELQQNIIMVGFTKEVGQYYRKAMVYVGTSAYEGFSLTFCEALTYAVPIVTYDMPWLTFIQDGRGIVTVKQKRYDLLAKEVTWLLKHPEQAKVLGLDGKKQVEEMAQSDIGAEWKELFDNSNGDYVGSSIENDNEKIIYKYMSIYQQLGKKHIKNSLNLKLENAYRQKSEINQKLQITYDEKFERGIQIKELKRQVESLKREKDSIKNSTTFMVGKIIMFIPKIIKKSLSCIVGGIKK